MSSEKPNPEANDSEKESKDLHWEKLTPEDKLSVYWEAIGYIYDLNRTSEVKAGLIISFYGLLLGVVFQIATTLETDFRFSAFLIVVLVGFIFFVGRSIYFSFKCFMPQIETKFDQNMFFFHDVITQYGDIRSFSKKFSDMLEQEKFLYDQLGQQIYVNSLIATKKFGDVNKSIRNLVYSFVPMSIAALTIIASIYIF
jgi:hypothetical protein